MKAHASNAFGPGVLAAGVLLAMATQARAQNRGVYPLGMSAINSGVTPSAGFTYVNQLLFYFRDHALDDAGNVLPATGENTVIMDMNTFAWVSGPLTWLGDAAFSASATLPFAKNSLTSDVEGQISGGAGFADSFYQPFILGWNGHPVAVRIAYGFLAPTGRFDAGANDNVGSGYWTQTVSSGQTGYLTGSRRLVLSAFEMYEFHSVQEGTGVHPGETFDLDYSIMGVLGGAKDTHLQVGLVGYSQRQTTDRTGPAITAEESAARYAVNALGIAVQAAFPHRRASLGVKGFAEFSNRSTYQGFSLQAVGAIGL